MGVVVGLSAVAVPAEAASSFGSPGSVRTVVSSAPAATVPASGKVARYTTAEVKLLAKADAKVAEGKAGSTAAQRSAAKRFAVSAAKQAAKKAESKKKSAKSTKAAATRSAKAAAKRTHQRPSSRAYKKAYNAAYKKYIKKAGAAAYKKTYSKTYQSQYKKKVAAYVAANKKAAYNKAYNAAYKKYAAMTLTVSGSGGATTASLYEGVPATATKVVTASVTTKGRGLIGSLLPKDVGAVKLLEKAPGNIQGLAYVETPARTSTSYGRYALIEMATAEQARDLARWFDRQPGIWSRILTLSGRFLGVASTSFIPPKVPKSNILTRSDFRECSTADAACAWVDFSSSAATITGDKGLKMFVPATLTDLRGLKSRTVWNGTSEDMKTFEGTWISGGFDSKKVNSTRANRTLEHYSISDRKPGSPFRYRGSTAGNALGSSRWNGVDKGLGETDAKKSQWPAGVRVEITELQTFNYYMTRAPFSEEATKYQAYGFMAKGATWKLING